MSTRPTRREFLKAAAATATAPTILRAQRTTSAAATTQTVAPSDRIRFAMIGLGIRGQQDARSAVRAPGVELAAVADIYDGHLTLAKEIFGSSLVTTRDYREILARRDIDAV